MDISLVSTGTPEFDDYPDPNYGTATQIWGLATCFSERGHNVTIYCGTHGSRDRYLLADDIEIIEIPTPSIDEKLNGIFTKLLFSKRVARRLEADSPDIVLLRERVTAVFPARLDVPSIYTVISPDAFDFFYDFSVENHQMNRLLHRYKKFIQHRVFEHVDAIGVINEWMRTYLRNLGHPETYYLPMGIPESDYAPVSEKQWDETVLFAGRMEPIKRPEWALDAFDAVSDSPFELQMVGDGSLTTRLQSMADDRSITDSVEFTGWIDRADLLERMHDASILIHPAAFEMGGNVILEGLALGCGVIASDTMGASTLIDDGETGRLFHSARRDELTAELSTLVETGDYRQLGRNAQRSVDSRHAMQHVSDRYLDLMTRLLE